MHFSLSLVANPIQEQRPWLSRRLPQALRPFSRWWMLPWNPNRDSQCDVLVRELYLRSSESGSATLGSARSTAINTAPASNPSWVVASEFGDCCSADMIIITAALASRAGR
jgi:hypothetical protein